MENIPLMISTKDLSYIEDIFNWNFVVAKTINCFKNNVQDEEIKNFFDDLYKSHKDICQKLIDILSGKESYEQ